MDGVYLVVQFADWDEVLRGNGFRWFSEIQIEGYILHGVKVSMKVRAFCLARPLLPVGLDYGWKSW